MQHLSQYVSNYTVSHKKCDTSLLSISLSIIDQFSKFFQWHTLPTISNNVIIIYPTNGKYVSTLPCEIKM